MDCVKAAPLSSFLVLECLEEWLIPRYVAFWASSRPVIASWDSGLQIISNRDILRQSWRFNFLIYGRFDVIFLERLKIW